MPAKKKSRGKPIYLAKAGNVEVPVWKTKNRQYLSYQLAWYEGGVRKRRTFNNVSLAKKESQRIATAIHNQRASQLKLDAVAAEEYAACLKFLPEGMTLVEAVKRGVRKLTTNPSTVREA